MDLFSENLLNFKESVDLCNPPNLNESKESLSARKHTSIHRCFREEWLLRNSITFTSFLMYFICLLFFYVFPSIILPFNQFISDNDIALWWDHIIKYRLESDVIMLLFRQLLVIRHLVRMTCSHVTDVAKEYS